MENGTCAFFLGANTRDGFCALTDSLRAERGLTRIYTVKAGPGCGKSAVLRKLGGALAGGERREDLLCSSDPRSLDGVVLHRLGAVLLDGTAPHVAEPDFPGADGDYLPLPPLRDTRALRDRRPALLALRTAAEQKYQSAYRQIRAAALVDESLRRLLLPLWPVRRLEARADGILARELPRRPGPGTLRRRFLDGITPEGLLFLRGTVEALCPRVYVIEDRYGFAQGLLERLRDGALARGWEVYACLSPLDPARLLHLLLPEAGLAFVSEDGTRLPDCRPARRIRVDASGAGEGFRAVRGRAKALLRLRAALLDDAVAEIAAAHRLHDRIEEIYRPCVDFAAQDACVAALAARIEQG